MFFKLPRGDFNPRPRKEGDLRKIFLSGIELLYFNPRPRKEGDSAISMTEEKESVFQSTPS